MLCFSISLISFSSCGNDDYEDRIKALEEAANNTNDSTIVIIGSERVFDGTVWKGSYYGYNSTITFEKKEVVWEFTNDSEGFTRKGIYIYDNPYMLIFINEERANVGVVNGRTMTFEDYPEIGVFTKQ